MIPMWEQWQIFLTLVGTGLVLALAFDCYRVGRYFWRPSILGTYAGDFLFWLIFTPLIFFLIMLINRGEIRAYVFFAIFTGSVIYFLLLSSDLRRVLYEAGHVLIKVIALIRRMFNRTVFLIFIPGRRFISILTWPVNTVKLIGHFFKRSKGF